MQGCDLLSPTSCSINTVVYMDVLTDLLVFHNVRHTVKFQDWYSKHFKAFLIHQTSPIKSMHIYSHPKVDRIFFWRVRDLCWNDVGCRPLKNKQVVGIFRGRSKTGSWNMVCRVLSCCGVCAWCSQFPQNILSTWFETIFYLLFGVV